MKLLLRAAAVAVALVPLALIGASSASAAPATTWPAGQAAAGAPASVVQAAELTAAPASVVRVADLTAAPADVVHVAALPEALPDAPSPVAPTAPASPAAPSAPVSTGDGGIHLDVNGVNGKPSGSIVVILGITLLSVAPALLLMTTCFTKILVVLGLTRNALGLQNTPPNQVLAGLALFLSLFIMAPVLSQVNEQGVQPYLHGTKTVSVAFHDGVEPLREFMLDHTRKDELALVSKAAKRDLPADRESVELTTLIPAFVLSELKSAFIIGFVVFIPFLVIDIVVSASLMSMGMMMLPPVVISLPFKLLLFVLVDGWGLVVTSLVSSYTGGGA